MKSRNLPIFVGILVAVAATTVDAAPILFFNDPAADRAAFQAAAGPLVLESFETAWPLGPSISFPIGGPQAFTASTPGGPGENLSQSSFPRGVTDGSFSMFVNEDFDTSVTFTFDSPINAFGLDVNDLNWANMSFADNLGNVANNVLLRDDCGPAGGSSCENIQFFGVVNAAAFTSVRLAFDNVTGQTGSIFLDRLEYASVPEPATLLLLGGGLAGLALRRRRA